MTYTTDKTAKSKSAFCINNLKANDVSKYAHISTVNLSHRLTGEVIVKSNVKVQPPLADMLQTPTAYGQHQHSVVMPFTPMGEIETINHLQVFPQTEDMLKGVTRFDIGIYRNQTITFDNRLKGVKTYYFGEYQVDKKLTFTNSLLRKYRSTSRARSCIETHLKDKKVIAKGRSNNYANHALSKISKLALVSYHSNGVQSARAFFVRNIPMRPHIVMVELWGNTSECASDRLSLLTNPLQLCLPILVNGGKAPISNGVHTHV